MFRKKFRIVEDMSVEDKYRRFYVEERLLFSWIRHNLIPVNKREAEDCMDDLIIRYCNKGKSTVVVKEVSI